MKKNLIIMILFFTACSSSNDTTFTLQDPSRDRSIDFQVWAPEVAGEKYPLVLLSHGSGGEYTNHIWLIESLVGNGYIVAALNHPLNTTRDNSDKGVFSVWERPADMSRLLDHLLQDEKWSKFIDANRIAATGFSSGGYTVLALAGAIYDRELIASYCNSESRGPDCDLADDDSEVDYSRSSLSYKDERIKSAFAMAPAMGQGITEESLKNITLPVFIIAAEDDELAYVSLNAERYAKYIPTSTLELLPSGGTSFF